MSLVRPIRRELGRYSGTRPTDDQTDARTAAAAPFRGNVGEAIRAAIRSELTAEAIRLYGDGLLAPYFRETLNRMGMVKAEHDASRRYMMEGSLDDVTRAMHAAGYSDFVANQEGVRALVGHLVRQLLERQDRLVETGPRFSPMKTSHDQASRLPAILDFHRWRVTVHPNLGPTGYVRITGIVMSKKKTMIMLSICAGTSDALHLKSSRCDLCLAGTQKYHKGVITNLLGARDERSFTWFGRGWEVRLNLFFEQAFNGAQHDPRLITNMFMGDLYRYYSFEMNNRGRPHIHAMQIDDGNEVICGDVKQNMNRSAIEDGAEEIGYEDIEEMNDRRRLRLAGEDAVCKEDNKTYMGSRRYDGDDSGSGFSGAGYGGWKRGGHDYTAPART